MAKPETSVPSILRTFDKTGEVPAYMLPLQQPDDEFDPDPTKPLRGTFEAILLARASQPVLSILRRELFQFDRPSVRHNMTPIQEMDEKDDQELKIELLEDKKNFVVGKFEEYLEASLTEELDPTSRKRLPVRVSFAYEQLDQLDNAETQVDDIMGAAETLERTLSALFHIAKFDYPKILGSNPSARQMVDLVGNSYATFVHIIAARHTGIRLPINWESFHLGHNMTIDTSSQEHKIALVNPGQYLQKEEEMRKKGKIVSATIHCPFSISSQFTEPFLDSEHKPFDTNPLKHTFQTLVTEFIGS